MVAVLLGLVAATFFGAMTVAVRAGLDRVPDSAAGAFVTASVGFAVALVVDLVISAGPDDLTSSELWPFLIAGLMAPGVAGLLFILAVELASAARTAVLITAAPLIAALPAFLLLGEPFHIALAGGAVLIVAGGIVLGRERLEEVGFRRIGLLAALASALPPGRRRSPRPPFCSSPICSSCVAALPSPMFAERASRSCPAGSCSDRPTQRCSRRSPAAGSRW